MTLPLQVVSFFINETMSVFLYISLLLVLAATLNLLAMAMDADEAEADRQFEESLAQMEQLAGDALARGLTRRESLAELHAKRPDLARGVLFDEMYPVVFWRLEQKQAQARTAPTEL